MRNALEKLKAKNPNSSFVGLNNFTIQPSHLYIKFKPKDIDEEGNNEAAQ